MSKLANLAIFKGMRTLSGGDLFQSVNEYSPSSKVKYEKKSKKQNILAKSLDRESNESKITLSSNVSLNTTPSVSLSALNIATSINSFKSKDVCLIEESPYFIHKIAQTERLDEFKRLYYEDPSRLYLRDTAKNWVPIHYAAFKSKIRNIDFILEKSVPDMINYQDLMGNTPLHIAIEKGNIDCCLYLLNKGADVTIKNKAQHAPIHQCVLFHRPEILELLISHDSKPDLHLGGENGSTALHYCSYTDNLECAKILVKYGSNLCKPCNNGFFPIHVAAQSCANKLLEFLIAEGCKSGFSKLKMLSIVDGDNNKPLHAAVQFGNVGAVRLCLENGASIDEVIEIDKSTPIHIACSQGSLEILKIMYEKQCDLFLEVIQTEDINHLTPLHRAAMFDHVQIAGYLIDKGAYIDAVDKEKRTPMLLAASRNCIDMVCFLLSQGASIKLKDSKLRNLLHLIVSQELNNNLPNQTSDSGEKSTCAMKMSIVNSLERVSQELIKKDNYVDLLKEQDIDGSTVMHYASRFGYVHCLKLLIKHGADISTKNNDKQSPLHFAAKFGRYSSCLQILNSENYKNYINEKDNNGLTPLHLASQNGHSRVVQLLLQKGALVYKSFKGNNPFHEAALNGSTSCMKIIYNIDSHVLNSANKDGNTALHLACQEGHSNVIEFLLDCGADFLVNNEGSTFIDEAIKYKQEQALMAIISHVRWEEALDLKSKEFKTPFIGIIQMSAEVTQAVMERCVTRKHYVETCEKKFSIHYNFKYLNWSEEKVTENGKIQFSPMLPLMMMVKYGRTDCLSHPLCECLLQRKWTRYGLPLYTITTIFYLLFLSLLTIIIVTHPTCLNSEIAVNTTLANGSFFCSDSDLSDTVYVSFKSNRVYELLSSLCILFSVINIMKEILQMSIEKFVYLRNFQVYIQLILYPLTIVFGLTFLISPIYSYNFRWEVGTVVIFTAWFNLLLYMQRFYIFGIYVVMFTEILKTLFKVIFLFSILIIAFGLVFFIIFSDGDIKLSLPLSILRTTIMMLGEIEGLNSFIIPFINGQFRFGYLCIVFLALFIFLIPILLTNLLIGLAVGDIESIQKNAKLKREAMQVQLHVDLERKMPKKILEKVNEMEYLQVYGRNCGKLGFLESLLNKVKNPDSIYADGISTDPNQMLYLELLEQKERLKIMKSSIDNQNDLIKLIIQKMEIRTDSDQYDAVPSSADKARRLSSWRKSIEATTPTLRTIVLKNLMSSRNAFDQDDVAEI